MIFEDNCACLGHSGHLGPPGPHCFCHSRNVAGPVGACTFVLKNLLKWSLKSGNDTSGMQSVLFVQDVVHCSSFWISKSRCLQRESQRQRQRRGRHRNQPSTKIKTKTKKRNTSESQLQKTSTRTLKFKFNQLMMLSKLLQQTRQQLQPRPFFLRQEH